MSTAIWTGAGGSGAHPKSGTFENAANWAAGATPAKDQDVAFAAGRYTVDLSQSGYEVGAVTIGTGVTLRSTSKPDIEGYLVATQDTVNYGTLSLVSGAYNQSSGDLVNFGQIVGVSIDYLSTVRGGGVLQNYGLIHEVNGSVMGLQIEVENQVGGVIDTQGGGEMFLGGSLNNMGSVSAIDGGYMVFSYNGSAGTTSNLSGGVLNGGHWSAIGPGSSISFRDADGLNTLAGGAVVTLSGFGSGINCDDTTNHYTSLEDSLSNIAQGAELHILGGRSYSTNQVLDVDGLLELGGGTLYIQGIIVHDDATSAMVGYGVVNSDIDMYGVLRATANQGGVSLALDGNNTIYSGSLVGSGVLEIAGGVTSLHQGAHALVKGLLVSGGELDLGGDLVYGGKLQVSGDGALHLGGDTLRITGSLSQVNGLIDNGALQIETSAVTVQGPHAEWGADVRNNGEVDVLNGQFTLDGSVNGVGGFLVSGAAALEFGASVTGGQTVDLQGTGGKLVFDHAQAFRGQVAEFGAGDMLDLPTFALAGATLSWKGDSGGAGGTLTVTSGADVAAIHLTDAHIRNGFHLVDDGTGHAAVTYGSTSAAHADFVI